MKMFKGNQIFLSRMASEMSEHASNLEQHHRIPLPTMVQVHNVVWWTNTKQIVQKLSAWYGLT
jgi:hypothetical protein